MCDPSMVTPMRNFVATWPSTLAVISDLDRRGLELAQKSGKQMKASDAIRDIGDRLATLESRVAGVVEHFGQCCDVIQNRSNDHCHTPIRPSASDAGQGKSFVDTSASIIRPSSCDSFNVRFMEALCAAENSGLQPAASGSGAVAYSDQFTECDGNLHASPPESLLPMSVTMSSYIGEVDACVQATVGVIDATTQTDTRNDDAAAHSIKDIFGLHPGSTAKHVTTMDDLEVDDGSQTKGHSDCAKSLNEDIAGHGQDAGDIMQ